MSTILDIKYIVAQQLNKSTLKALFKITHKSLDTNYIDSRQIILFNLKCMVSTLTIK